MRKYRFTWGDNFKFCDNLQIFDDMSITDERVVEVSKETNQVYPYVMLKSCLSRNFAMTENEISVSTSMQRKGRHIWIICDMTVGDFSVKVFLIIAYSEWKVSRYVSFLSVWKALVVEMG